MLVIFFLTIVSCLVFDYVNLKSTSVDLINSYKELPSILSNKDISDDEKQKNLLKSSKFQFKKLIELTFKIIVFLSPFSLIILFDISFLTLLETRSVIISIIGVISFILIKKLYEKILKDK
jgi:hypothetical protein